MKFSQLPKSLVAARAELQLEIHRAQAHLDYLRSLERAFAETEAYLLVQPEAPRARSGRPWETPEEERVHRRLQEQKWENRNDLHRHCYGYQKGPHEISLNLAGDLWCFFENGRLVCTNPSIADLVQMDPVSDSIHLGP